MCTNTYQRIKKSFGYDPLQCPRCGRTLDFVVSFLTLRALTLCAQSPGGPLPGSTVQHGQPNELAEIWEPTGGHIWMKKWLAAHRMRKAARQVMQHLLVRRSRRYYQLAFNFDT